MSCLSQESDSASSLRACIEQKHAYVWDSDVLFSHSKYKVFSSSHVLNVEVTEPYDSEACLSMVLVDNEPSVALMGSDGKMIFVRDKPLTYPYLLQ